MHLIFHSCWKLLGILDRGSAAPQKLLHIYAHSSLNIACMQRINQGVTQVTSPHFPCWGLLTCICHVWSPDITDTKSLLSLQNNTSRPTPCLYTLCGWHHILPALPTWWHWVHITPHGSNPKCHSLNTGLEAGHSTQWTSDLLTAGHISLKNACFGQTPTLD